MASDELQQVLQAGDPWAADLLLSCLAAAAGSYRRATTTMPFPTAIFGDSERDYAGLLENLQSLPLAARLKEEAAAGRLTGQQAGLLQWLVGHPRRPLAGMRRCTLRQVQEQLPHLTGWVADIGMNPSLRPAAVLQLAGVDAAALGGGGGTGSSGGSSNISSSAAASARRVLAFHGTSMENMHSILHNGLLNASGTRLERTGSAFGKGIYFSSELPVAFAFCQPADGWTRSALGRRLRCLLVCSIDKEHAHSSHNSDMVPDKYIVVERMDAVQIHFVFVYSDDAAVAAAAASVAAAAAAQQQPRLQDGGAAGVAAAVPQPRQQRSPLLYVILAYLGWLLCMYLQNNWPYIRRLLRRQLGLRF